VKRGKNSSWETVHEEVEGDRIVVSDGTGLAEVSFDGAELIVTEKTTHWKDLPPHVQEAALARWGGYMGSPAVTGSGFFASLGSPRIRFKEGTVLVGSPVYVRGSFRTSRGRVPWMIEPHAYRFLARIAELKKEPSRRKRAFDINRDGNIDESEIRYGSRRLHEEAAKDVSPEDRAEPVAFQGSFAYDEIHRLIVGDCHQEHLVRKLGWSLVLIFGGILAIAAGLGVIAQTILG
jgi:hypothetical protein